MFTPPSSNPSVGQIVNVSRIDRWVIYHRLQELMIPCWCPADGSLRVEVNNSVAAVLVRSTVQQFVASRQELVEWLERCWRT
ncbi:MAG TPA: Asr1405/Asl0597 family protein [Oculatellaceae cyanobacterium]